MRLRKPIITILLIIVLVLNLIFFSFVSISRTFTNQEYVLTLLEEFDVKNYLKNNQNINNSVDNYKYPIEIFDYISDDDISLFKEKLVDNLVNEKDFDLDNELSSIIYKSIDIYDAMNLEDSYDFVKDDINLVIEKFNDYYENNCKNIFSFMKTISNNFIFYFSIILSIIMCGIIIYIEKEKGLLIDFVILFFYSLFMYYVNNNFYSIISSLLGKEYLDIKFLKNYTFLLDKVYIICFIFSFVLLLMCIFISIRKTFKSKN